MGNSSDRFYTHQIKSLIAVVLIGFLSVITGTFILTGEIITNGLTQSDLVLPVQNYLLYSRFLIISEILLAIAFSFLTILIIILYNRITSRNLLLLSLGIFRGLLLLLLIAFFWNPGWEQILNPHGGFKASIFIVLLGFAQSFTMIFGIAKD